MGLNLVVVVAGVLGVDLPRRPQPGGSVEGARGDADGVPVGRVPEQARAALGAEAAARVRLALRAVDPAQRAVLDDPHVGAMRGRGRPDVAGPAPALAAMTEDDVPGPVRFEANRPAAGRGRAAPRR